MKNKSYSFYGEQLDFGLLEDTGHVVANDARPHSVTVHSNFEFIYLKRGIFKYQIDENDNINLHGGQVLITRPGELVTGKDGIFYPCDIFWVLFAELQEYHHINTPFLQAELVEMMADLNKSKKRIFNATPFLKDSFDVYSGLLDKCMLYHKIPAADKSQKLKCPSELKMQLRATLSSIIVEMKKCVNKSNDNAQNVLVERACFYMQKNFDDDFSIENMVIHLGVSESYLYKVFEKETGVSPNGYLQSLRLEKAYHLILNSNESITTIAFEAGYSSSQYFSKVFKNFFGKTPSKLRNDGPPHQFSRRDITDFKDYLLKKL